MGPRTPWYGTVIILLSEVMGTGILSLPYSAVSLGWVVSLCALPIFAAFAAYSGLLLAFVKRDYPEFKSFADASRDLVSPAFGSFTKACMILNWGALAVYFLIATADAIGAIYNKGFMSCQRNRCVIAAIILVIPCQCRDFHSISKFLSTFYVSDCDCSADCHSTFRYSSG